MYYLIEILRWDVSESWAVLSKYKTLKRAESARARLQKLDARRGGFRSLHVFESPVNASRAEYPLLLLTFKPPSIFRTSHME